MWSSILIFSKSFSNFAFFSSSFFSTLPSTPSVSLLSLSAFVNICFRPFCSYSLPLSLSLSLSLSLTLSFYSSIFSHSISLLFPFFFFLFNLWKRSRDRDRENERDRRDRSRSWIIIQVSFLAFSFQHFISPRRHFLSNFVVSFPPSYWSYS